MTRDTSIMHPEVFTHRNRQVRDLVNETDRVPFRSRAADAQLAADGNSSAIDPIDFARPFCDFLSGSPTVFHAVDYFSSQLQAKGYKKLSSRDAWELKAGEKYFVTRNGSALIAFAVGPEYKPGNGFSIVAGHIDALTIRLKPISKVANKAGYVQLAVAPYAGGMNSTWWDRDLGIGGRVLVKQSNGKIVEKLVNVSEPIARIPTLAPHFGAISQGPFNKETRTVPIIGLESSVSDGSEGPLGGAGSFASTQPPRLVKRICKEIGVQDYASIVSWELELFDSQPAQLGGLDKEFIFAGRIDDKLCSWAAVEGLLNASDTSSPGSIKCVGLFDDEEIGSLLRQGARSAFFPSVVERVVDSFTSSGAAGANAIGRTYANSFLISADVTHAVNPNFIDAYLENHMPRLNVGLTVAGDANGHMTTDAVSAAFLARIAAKSDCKLQIFQIKNGEPSGGTIGPALSSLMGLRAVDAGLAQLSMHSIRATCGSLDPGLGVKIFKGFYDHFEEVDEEFRSD